MKTIILLFCLALTAAIASAQDYHLVQTQMLDSERTNGRPLTVYVLLMPDNTQPKVFKTFDSKEMKAWIGALPAGSVVHYDANAFLPPVTPTQLEALKAVCRKKGVIFVESPTP